MALPTTYAPAPGAMRLPTSSSNILNNALPGLRPLTSSATRVVGSLLAGQPGTSTARRANAYFGGGSGVPGSDFVRNRGFDLYGEQGDARKQQGFQDLLSMLGAYASPALQANQQALQERGQNIQADQFGAQQNLELEKFGFDKNKYFDAMHPQKKLVPHIPGGVPGGPLTNVSIDQMNWENAGRI